MWSIYCFDSEDWIHPVLYGRQYDTKAYLVFETKKEACKRAAEEYGFATYTEAKRAGMCEVRLVGSSMRDRAKALFGKKDGA